MQKLGSSPNVNNTLRFISDAKNTVLQYDSGHLNSFAGGNVRTTKSNLPKFALTRLE